MAAPENAADVSPTIFDPVPEYGLPVTETEESATRLRKEARHVRMGDKTISQMISLTIREALEFIKSLALFQARLAGMAAHLSRH
jgi:excinuclease UvrABC ATPase subunit